MCRFLGKPLLLNIIILHFAPIVKGENNIFTNISAGKTCGSAEPARAVMDRDEVKRRPRHEGLLWSSNYDL